ncbi:MAG: MBL fold metallo-hydrolase [Candidatus Methanoplasma sp.]|jgi:7,8-dihydropterin-6-yl-methyl-4-(beta-D-ribofuranosyl)aminobenzene 5'-phosphate synthase|nr:MBL fold metallo-hydrolase [Candidatus Methanoplasma sp.]
MQAKITSVYDEGALVGTSLIGAKGFAVLIETGGRKILFDTGRRGRYLLHNLMFLDIRPESIDKVVISHGHASHTGGLDDILKTREAHMNIYAPASAAGERRLLGAKGIRIPAEFSERADVLEVRDWMEIAEKTFVSRPMDIGDDQTEVFMVLLSKKGPVVISACSHAGVDMIMEAVKKRFGSYPHTYIGGVHIGRKGKEKASAITTSFIEKNCLDLHLNHCTGVRGMMYLRADMGLRGVNDFYAGSVLRLDM